MQLALYSYDTLPYIIHGARVLLSVRIVDLLSGRRAGSWFETAEKNHELFLGWEGGREVVGWRIRGSSTCLPAADGFEKCRTIWEVHDHLRLHQFSARRRCRACRLSHHFDSLCGGYLLFAYVRSTGVFGAIHMCFKDHCMRVQKRGERGVSSWSTVGVCLQCEEFVRAKEVSPHFL